MIRSVMSKTKIPQLLLCFLLEVLLSQTIRSNTVDYYFKQLTIDKELSQSTVTGILSDANGMIWIGTSSGLNHFDHYEMKSYFYDKDTPFSLPGNYIHFVIEDKQKNIWISTDKGLVRYNRSNDRFLPAIPDKQIRVFSHFPQKDGILFGGENMLYKYTYAQQKIECIPVSKTDASPFTISFIVPHGEQELLLISSNSGIQKYNLQSHSFEQAHFPAQFQMIKSVYLDKEGNLYLAPYKQGLVCYDRQWKEKFHLTTANSKLTNDIILSIEEKEGKLWVATDGGGIHIIDRSLSVSSIRHVPGDVNSMPVNSITCLYKDKQDNLFAGSVRGGMFGIKEVSIKTYRDVPFHCTYGLSEKTVISLYEDKKGILWIGTDGGGVNSYNPTTDTFTYYPSTANGKVVSITNYSDSELLISLFSDRTYLFNKATAKCTPFDIINPKITKQQCSEEYTELSYRLSEHKIYFLSSVAYVYDTRAKTFSELRTKEDKAFLKALNPVYADSQAAYFIQYRGNRLFEVRQDNDSLRTLLCIDKTETIKAACRDKQGIFWIGTDYGFAYFNPKTKEYRKIETKLFNNVSTLLCDNQGRLWIGAQNMLFSYDIQEKKFVLWGESDGFITNELPYIYQSPPTTDNIYLGGVSGLVRIDQHISSNDEALPQVKLADVQVDGNSFLDNLINKSSLTLPWDYSSLVIKVLSIEKDIFRKRLFRYTIVGSNQQETETYNHTLSLQTFPPGEYSIWVSCNAKSGDWTPPKEILHLMITPPWYKRPIILLGAFLVLGGVAVRALFSFVKRKEKKMTWAMSVHEQKVNKEKIQFLINVSHELRTPLTLAYAPLKRILDTKEWQSPGTHLQEQLTSIYKQVQQMKEMLNMTLDVNKIEEEANVLHKTPYHINPWIESVAEEFNNEFKEKKIRLEYQLENRNPIVTFDCAKCKSVLSNLLMNALKFSPSGTHIKLSSQLMNDSIRISVSDQGIGLDNVDMDKLFTRYYQGNHDKPGSGIGLAYAKALIEKHGGIIGATNNEEQGVTFYFELPLTEKQEGQKEQDKKICPDNLPVSPHALIETEKEDPHHSTQGYSIMIVEDNEELRTFLRQSLQSLFKNVYTAPDGNKAWTMIGQKLPDIIVSDVMMPFMDGFELCKKVKEDLTTSHIPVVLLTARGDLNSKGIGYKLGADAYLSKPFEEELLITIIINQLKSREAIKRKYRESFLNYSNSEPMEISNLDEEFLSRINKLIDENMGLKDLDVKFLTENMGMSRTPLFTKIKALTNMGINDYINMARIEKAAHLLLTSPLTITEISEAVGFEYQRYFSTMFKRIKGKTPSQYRQDRG